MFEAIVYLFLNGFCIFHGFEPRKKGWQSHTVESVEKVFHGVESSPWNRPVKKEEMCTQKWKLRGKSNFHSTGDSKAWNERCNSGVAYTSRTPGAAPAISEKKKRHLYSHHKPAYQHHYPEPPKVSSIVIIPFNLQKYARFSPCFQEMESNGLYSYANIHFLSNDNE
jgi:hypothetical protein